MRLSRTIPALPVRQVEAAVDFYVQRMGFAALHVASGFAVIKRDDAELHLWECDDERWTSRGGGASPVISGAESFLAGTASCRIEVDAVDALYDELRVAQVLHQVSDDGVATTDFGTREFATGDLDGNLVSFFTWVS